LWLSCCCCCCVSPCSGAGGPAEDRAGSAVVLARAISSDNRRGRRSSGNLLSLLPDSSGHAGSIPALFRPSTTVTAAGGWGRWTERCCVGSNATSSATDGRGEDEPRGWHYFSGASEQRGVVLLATSRLLTIKSDRHAVCGRKAVVFDRWSNHLLVKIILLLPYPCYHLLVEYASCSSSI